MIFQSSSRSIKRQRLLKKALITCFITSFIFIIYLNKTEIGAEVQPVNTSSSPLLSHNNIHHDKYHLQQQQQHHYTEKQHEVAVPRKALLESMRKARQERLSRYSQENEASQSANTIPVEEKEVMDEGQEVEEETTIPTKEELKQQQQKESIPIQDITSAGEDKVYKKESDNKYLPSGDGKDIEEKYISYLPHSGFHNQRIAMVNAIMLAHRLNRTLLLPPVKLGAPIHWRKHDSLESYHRRLSKANLAHCRLYLVQDEGKNSNNNNNNKNAPSSCQQSFKYTSLRWDRLFSLEGIKQKVRIRYRDDYDRHYLETKFGITKANTYFIKDELLYDYRIIENNLGGLHKYQRIIKVEDLDLRNERLISFGSLFGNGRMILQDKSLLTYLNQQFIFDKNTLPGLFDEMDRMLSILGGPLSYISIHARTGDSIFERFAPQVMEKLWKDLKPYLPVLEQSKYLQQQQVNPSHKCYEAPPSNPLLGPAIDWEQKKVINQRSLVMFMATDSMNPRENDLFKNIYQHFPCVVTLNDLFDFKASPLSTMINPEDGINYGKFLIPFLDGLMASRGQTFNGSMWSTFSKYIEYLHDAFISS